MTMLRSFPTLGMALSFALIGAAANAAEPVTTASGLVYQSTRDGQGESPKATDTVIVHYRGTFPDGKEFDSSYSRGQPAEFPLNRVIPCWTEGVQRMKPGGKAKLVCPPAIAYGSRGAGKVIPPDATPTQIEQGADGIGVSLGLIEDAAAHDVVYDVDVTFEHDGQNATARRRDHAAPAHEGASDTSPESASDRTRMPTPRRLRRARRGGATRVRR